MCDEYKITEICELKDRLISCAQAEFAKGLENVSTEEAGEVIDMIKDLAQTEKYCREAIITGWFRRPWRTLGMGILPIESSKESIGLTWTRTSSMRRNGIRASERKISGTDEHTTTGRSPRRYYTQTNSPQYREDMDAHAAEHIGDTLATIREIWKNADPELRKRMKSDFTTLVNEMNV